MIDISSLPTKFQKNINKTFGTNGAEFIKNLPATIEGCVYRWELENLIIPPNLSFNFIAVADSRSYGRVVLKISPDHKEFLTEATYAQNHRGKATRRALAVDLPAHAMVLQYIDPGYTLDSVKQKDTQTRIAIEVITSNPQPVPAANPIYPTYGEWMERTFALTRRRAGLPTKITEGFNTAAKLYIELCDQYPEKYLLHGDLHHENILYSNTSGWKVIDPKGVVDSKYLEVGRYIRNELWRVDPSYGDIATHCTKDLAARFAQTMKTSPEIVYNVTFIDTVLSNSWDLEGDMSDSDFQESIITSETEIEFFHRFL